MSVGSASELGQSQQLRDVVSKLVDGSHNTPPKQGVGKPMLSARNIDQGRVNFDAYRLISEEAFIAEDARTRIVSGDILLTIVGTIGRAAVVPEGMIPFSLQRSVAVLSPKQDVLPKYLCYQLQSPRIQRHFEANARGTAQKGVYLKTLGETPVYVPAVEKQRAVVAEIEKQFSRLDEAVANLKRVKANLKRYKAAVLKAAVEGRLVPTEAELARKEGRDYETGEQLLERTRLTRSKRQLAIRAVGSDNEDVLENRDALPQGWSSATIGEVFNVYVGATPSRAERSYWNGEIHWVSSGEVSFCRIRSTRERISEAGLVNSSVRLHPKGTVLLGMIGEGKTRGQVAILDIEAGNNQNAAAIRVSETDVVPEYVYYFFEKEYETTRQRGSGGNQPALNKARVQSVLFPIPPVAEQTRIVAELEYRFTLIRGIETQLDANLQRAERMRQSLLSSAFFPSKMETNR